MKQVDLCSVKEQNFVGRNRRLLNEWKSLDIFITNRDDISYLINTRNSDGLPTQYIIEYSIRSISSVTNLELLFDENVINRPIFSSKFLMKITLPNGYPAIDNAAEFDFLTTYNGKNICHPWHPNIRYFGEFAGRVCLNKLDTYTSLVWCIERIASYLRYQRYHAINTAPYPEDLKVANWVTTQAEPNGWLNF